MNIIAEYVKHDTTHEPLLRLTANKRGIRATEFAYYGRAIRSRQYSIECTDENIEKVLADFGYDESNSHIVQPIKRKRLWY